MTQPVVMATLVQAVAVYAWPPGALPGAVKVTASEPATVP